MTFWNLTSFYFFLITIALATPLFAWGIWINVKNKKTLTPPRSLRYRITNINVEEFNKRIIFPFKIIAGILLLSEVIKQIANFGYNPLEDHYFTPAQLPFFFSDFQIFTLVAFVFSKPNTTFNKLGYVLFMMEGMAGSFFLLVAPNSVISFTTLSTDNFQYSTAHSFICHYAILYSFVWFAIWRIIKIDWKDILKGLCGAIMFSLTIICFSYIFRCNYNYALASPFSGAGMGFHPDWNYVEPLYASLIWFPITIAAQTGCLALVILTNNFKLKRNCKDTKVNH